jgi:hypothetical protein
MKHQHDDLANEQNAARAHNAMKWMYRGQNLVLLAVAGAIVAAPKRDRRDQAITAVAVGAIGFALWINSESAQWHARATDEHRGRAAKLEGEIPLASTLAKGAGA